MMMRAQLLAYEELSRRNPGHYGQVVKLQEYEYHLSFELLRNKVTRLILQI